MASIGDRIAGVFNKIGGGLPKVPQQNLQGSGTPWMTIALLGVGALVVYKFVLKR